jgi:hypothetical protein
MQDYVNDGPGQFDDAKGNKIVHLIKSARFNMTSDSSVWGRCEIPH